MQIQAQAAAAAEARLAQQQQEQRDLMVQQHPVLQDQSQGALVPMNAVRWAQQHQRELQQNGIQVFGQQSDEEDTELQLNLEQIKPKQTTGLFDHPPAQDQDASLRFDPG